MKERLLKLCEVELVKAKRGNLRAVYQATAGGVVLQ